MSQVHTDVAEHAPPVASTVLVADLLINDEAHAGLEHERSVLEPLGAELVLCADMDDDELIEVGKDAVAILVTYRPITARVLESLPNLKVVVKTGIGYNNIDTAAARDFGIWVVNVPDYCVEEVAAHALALIMDGLRAISYNNGQIRAGNWVKDLGSLGLRRPSTLTLGTLGMGRIARQLHEYVAPLIPSRKFFDPFIDNQDDVECCDSIDELFATCDIISLHLPLTAGTTHLVSDELLSTAKPGLLLVNTARADIVSRSALNKAVRTRRVAYYGTDVAWEEPLDPNHPENRALLESDRMTITPHMAWQSQQSEVVLRVDAAKEIARVLRGERPRHIVN